MKAAEAAPYGVRAEMRELDRLMRSAGCAAMVGGRLCVDREGMPPELRARFDRLVRACVRNGFY